MGAGWTDNQWNGMLLGQFVKFFPETGTNSFVDDTPTIDGVCQVCHDECQLPCKLKWDINDFFWVFSLKKP